MITGKILAQSIISGANNLTNYRQSVDELNVFPVPDGDTGTNMSMTINSALNCLNDIQDDATVEYVASSAASAMLRGARGNSGVILSILFRGFSNGFKNKESASTKDFAQAWSSGVEAAYKAVMKPTEGTILTVARESAEKANEIINSTNDESILLDELVKQAHLSLENTPNILPVLKKAGVVDAGGQGLVYILEGMKNVIQGDDIIPLDDSNNTFENFSSIIADYDEEINFTYCTEFIIDKNSPDCDPSLLRSYLETIGDCVVVVDDDEIIKTHVHTDNPGNAIQEALKFGPLTNIKIDNMRAQNKNKKESEASQAEEQPQAAEQETFEYRECENEFGFVAVAAGEGVKNVFKDLGADNVVSGGQTMNPSTDDILKAVHATPAKTVFILPNNKNIIMAAEQTIGLADRTVCVLPTKNIPQGITAMLNFDPELSASKNRHNMTQAFCAIQSGQITFAARDSEFSGHTIKKGEIMALENGKISFIDRDINKSLIKLVKILLKKHENPSFITLIYGHDISEKQANDAYDSIKSKFGSNCDVNLIKGDQPVYYYLVSVE